MRAVQEYKTTLKKEGEGGGVKVQQHAAFIEAALINTLILSIGQVTCV